jgi:hypothetical protein
MELINTYEKKLLMKILIVNSIFMSLKLNINNLLFEIIKIKYIFFYFDKFSQN